MAETGIIVDDAEQGESVACYTASELDDNLNARVVQLMDVAQRKHGFNRDTYAKVVRIVNESDTTDLTTLSLTLIDSAIQTGDKPILVVYLKYDTDIADFKFAVTPLVLDSDNHVVAFLPTKTFQGFNPGGAVAPFYYTDGGGESPINYHTLTQVQSWDVLGASKIVMHVSIVDTGSNGAFDGWCYVFADMITGSVEGANASGDTLLSGSYANCIDSMFVE